MLRTVTAFTPPSEQKVSPGGWGGRCVRKVRSVTSTKARRVSGLSFTFVVFLYPQTTWAGGSRCSYFTCRETEVQWRLVTDPRSQIPQVAELEKQGVPLPGAPRETEMSSVGTSLGREKRSPPRPQSLAHGLFSTTTICFQDFCLRPADDHGRDHFSWLSYPAICNYKTMGTSTLTLW